ncbi:cytochrome c oxidase assembly protein COX20, mitochondrial-like [Asterias rubens]|uniref:cytochrome c oxidase assembly protein COX20, mitochondrial-like n=1 Tax=Asterias rubens TaxID=7604 RepID=UPI0014556E94|nr:cytochrome c oxidase assembly protein COX20, mitochondrial-like [Asterias rubens]
MDENDSEKTSFSRVSSMFKSVPCSRNAFMFGILGGFGAGLTNFLLTSRVKRSADIGVAAFTLTTLVTFGYCRYNRAKLRLIQRRYEELHVVDPIDLTEVSYRGPGDLK